MLHKLSIITVVPVAFVAIIGCCSSGKQSAPVLKPVKDVSVLLYPNHNFHFKCQDYVQIPAENRATVLKLIAPTKLYPRKLNDMLEFIVAEVKLRYTDDTDDIVLVRWMGKNPAVVTLDGNNYYQTASDPDHPDGAMELRALVERIRNKK